MKQGDETWLHPYYCPFATDEDEVGECNCTSMYYLA